MRFSNTLQCQNGLTAMSKIELSIKKRTFDDTNANTDAEQALEHEHDSEARFLIALDVQIEKVFDFYTQKESELYSMLDQLEAEIESNGDINNHDDEEYYTRKSSLTPLENLDSTYRLLNAKDEDNENIGTVHKLEQIPPQHRASRARCSSRHSMDSIRGHFSRQSFESHMSMDSNPEDDYLVEQLSNLRSQLILLYISLSELESYIELNRTAFEKILKKYDKVLEGNLKTQYVNKMVLDSRPFMPQTMDMFKGQITRIENIFADAFCGGHRNVALCQMKTHLRDQVTFGRNTVWKDMVRQELKVHDTKLIEPAVIKSYKLLPFVNYRISGSLLRQLICFTVAVIIFIILLCVDCFSKQQENHCFALLIFAAIMWATEAIPLYATSMLIPFMIIPMSILRNANGSVMDAKSASKSTFQAMFSGTIMMLLGGFALAATLSKYGIAKALASHVLSRAGSRPMFVSAFLSMFISNVATPVFCSSLIDPIIRTLPDRSRVVPCLILGIALASCTGGMTSPISSPQNIVTIQYMNPDPGWGLWFAVALPVAIISLFVCWGLLLFVYRPASETPHLNTIKPTKEMITTTQVFIVLISLITIALWCAESSLEQYLGDTGIIAAIPLFVFFGTGILGKDDLNNFLWSVVVLTQGSMALDIASRLKDGISDLPLIAILAVFCFLILVFASFVSHTVAALTIVPVVQQFGQQLPVPHPNLLVMGAGLACSASMGLPVSGYPNMSAVMLEDPFGKPYLTSKDFLITGIPTSIICTCLIFTLGYGIMNGLGY